jgi:hypothetical protein
MGWFKRSEPQQTPQLPPSGPDITELALHGQPGHIVLFPANLVAKRWVAGETAVLPGLAAELIERVTQIRKA